MSPQLIYSVQAELCRTMGNAARLEIVHLLQSGPMHVGDMARALGLSQATVSRHVSALRNAGIVMSERKKEGIFYRIANTKIVKVCECWTWVPAMSDDGEECHQCVCGT